MNHFKNHFQKVSIALVVIMIMVIPNLHVYSSMGNYQLSSQAIIANNDYEKCSKSIEKPSALLGGLGLGFSVGTIVVLASSLALAVAIGASLGNVFLKNNQDYAAYDFSQFDNYTPSSMNLETRNPNLEGFMNTFENQCEQ